MVEIDVVFLPGSYAYGVKLLDSFVGHAALNTPPHTLILEL